MKTTVFFGPAQLLEIALAPTEERLVVLKLTPPVASIWHRLLATGHRLAEVTIVALSVDGRLIFENAPLSTYASDQAPSSALPFREQVAMRLRNDGERPAEFRVQMRVSGAPRQ